MQYQPVLTKQDFVRRFVAGEFGNKGPNWHTLKEWQKDISYKTALDMFHIRCRLPSGAGTYNVKACNVSFEWSCLKNKSDYYLAAMAPHEANVVQGEVEVVAPATLFNKRGKPIVSDAPCGLTLRYTTEVGLPMRDALAKSNQHAHGIIANCILRSTMCPNSYAWLQELLERYPGHVVEFSTFSRQWGTLPNYNTVFWEVRAY